LGELTTKRAALLQEYTPASKEIRQIDGEIAELQERMKQIAETVVSAKVRARNPALDSYLGALVNGAVSDARLRTLNRVAESRNREIDSLPEKERNITKLMQRVNILERTHQMLSEKYYTLLINEKSTVPSARLASAARPSPIPASPNKQRNAALFLLLGIMLSVAVAVVVERLDQRVRDEDTVSQLTGETALAIIPDEKRLRRSPVQMAEMDHNCPFVEAFRILRNVILFAEANQDLRLLAVTSPGRGEGKSTTAVNLAGAMAMIGKRVLLVDCDLRRPSLHRYLGIPNDVGLTNIVRGQASFQDAIAQTKVENVFCLPTGPLPHDPAEFLNSAQCRSALDQMLAEYDAVILDCPPCAGLSDMQVISTIAQGVLLVISMHRTLLPSLHRAIRGLTQVGASVIGVVINRLNVRRSGYDYYYYSDDTAKNDKRRR
jgi:capsular exopolysaccharide synthesis family protein